jgi:hypothetical protein
MTPHPALPRLRDRHSLPKGPKGEGKKSGNFRPQGLIFTHIFCWKLGVEFEVLVFPWVPRALYQGTASAVPKGSATLLGLQPLTARGSG